MVRRKWTKEDIAKLRELYPRTSAKELSKILAREVLSIHTKASRLRIGKDFNGFIKPLLEENREKSHRMRGHKVWTEDEIEMLEKIYSTTPREKIVNIFKCNWDTIMLKASRLGLKREWREIKGRWGEEEEKELKEMWMEGKTITEIAKN
ncbi:MAG: hypothetical protein H3Z54_13370 [archaeon]|nr:hypothetical protein [archaeon]